MGHVCSQCSNWPDEAPRQFLLKFLSLLAFDIALCGIAIWMNDPVTKAILFTIAGFFFFIDIIMWGIPENLYLTLDKQDNLHCHKSPFDNSPQLGGRSWFNGFVPTSEADNTGESSNSSQKPESLEEFVLPHPVIHVRFSAWSQKITILPGTKKGTRFTFGWDIKKVVSGYENGYTPRFVMVSGEPISEILPIAKFHATPRQAFQMANLFGTADSVTKEAMCARMREIELDQMHDTVNRLRGERDFLGIRTVHIMQFIQAWKGGRRSLVGGNAFLKLTNTLHTFPPETQAAWEEERCTRNAPHSDTVITKHYESIPDESRLEQSVKSA